MSAYKVVRLNHCGDPEINLPYAEFESYKVVRVGTIYYTWLSFYFGHSHRDIANKFSQGDFSKVACAGSFTIRPGKLLMFSEGGHYSMSLARTEANACLTKEELKRIASLIGFQYLSDS